MLEQPDPVFEYYIFRRVVEQCVVNRVAIELMAVIMYNSAKGVVTLRYRSTRNGVKFA